MARHGISTKNTEKIPPSLKFWTPRIYPENTPKIPKKYPQNTKNDRFWYFFLVFWGYFLVVPIFRPGGLFFRYFLWKFRVGPSRGSVAGGGILNPRRVFSGVGGWVYRIWPRNFGRRCESSFCLSLVARWKSRHFTVVTALGPQEVELGHPKVVVSWPGE